MTMPEQTPRLIKHHTSTVYILTDDKPCKVLMVHHRKYDKWVPPGGHQESWENPLEAALREVKEETGLDISPYMGRPTSVDKKAAFLPLPNYIGEFKVPAHQDEPEHYHIDSEYVVRLPEQTVTHQEAEAKDIGWFTLDQLAQMQTYPDVRLTLEREMNK